MGEFFLDEDEQRSALMEAIFREHFTAVHRYISNKVRQPDAVDDLTSMVFLKALRWLREDRGMSRVRSWLYTTARTTIAEYWQEQDKRPALPLEKLGDSAAVPAAKLPDNQQIQERVEHLLQMLAERERLILLLRYFQGYTAAEIGQELGLSAGHVRVLQLRALRRAALLASEERSIPMTKPSLTTYTGPGQRVLDLAKEEAHSLHHYYIGVEHLLLGLLSEGSATDLLVQQGATLELMRAALASITGVGQPDPHAAFPFTPRVQHVLVHAGEDAEAHGDTAISPAYMLDALLREKAGIVRGMLQLVGVQFNLLQQAPIQPSEEFKPIPAQIDEKGTNIQTISAEEEQRLAHLIARGEAEKRRAQLLKETPDASMVQEGQDAYFRLIKASYHLVLSVAKEYVGSGRNSKEIIDAGSFGLSIAATQFGMKRKTPFHTYAIHRIHMEIMDVLE